MANTITLDASPSLSDAITTGLNSLADDGKAVSSGLTNASLKKYLGLEFTLNSQGGSRAVDAEIHVYLLKSLDGGTDYDYGDASLTPGDYALAWVWDLDNSANARTMVATGIPIDAPNFKLLLVNKTGQALASGSNALKYWLYTDEIQDAP